MKKKAFFLLISLISLIVIYRLQNQESLLYVYAIGNPDSYGNVIMWLTVNQWNGTEYIQLLNHTTSDNWSVRVVENQSINITVAWRLNKTLASDETEARDYTRIFINLTDVWVNEEMNATGSIDSDASYWYGLELAHWNQTGKPESGVSYDVATRYEAYY